MMNWIFESKLKLNVWSSPVSEILVDGVCYKPVKLKIEFHCLSISSHKTEESSITPYAQPKREIAHFHELLYFPIQYVFTPRSHSSVIEYAWI